MRPSAVTKASELSSAELAELVSVLRSAGLRGKHLEIGTAAGGTLKELMLCYPTGNRPAFISVDPMNYFPNQLTIVQKNLRSAGIDSSEVDFRIGKSWPIFQEAEKNAEVFSFIFVDGSHKIHHVTEDLAWSRLLEQNGIICFHDYAPRFPGVTSAVNRFLADHRNYEVITRVESLLVVKKISKGVKREINVWDRSSAHLVNIMHQISRSVRKRWHFRQK